VWLYIIGLIAPATVASPSNQLPQITKFNIWEGTLKAECANQSSIKIQDSTSLKKEFQTKLTAIRLESKISSGRHLWNVYGTGALAWLINQFPMHFQCGRPIDLQQIQRDIHQYNQIVLKALSQSDMPEVNVSKNSRVPFPSSSRDQRAVLAMYDLETFVEGDNVLVFYVVFKKIHRIRVASACPYQEDERIISYLQDTLPIRGQKPDNLVLQALGFLPGDRLPENDVQSKAFDRVMDLNLFDLGSVVITSTDNDPNRLDYIVCLNQRNEAQLNYLEARKIGSTDVTLVRRSIAKYQEALSLFNKLKVGVGLQGKATRKDNQQRLVLGVPIPRYRLVDVSEVDALEGIASAYNSMGNYYEALRYYIQATSWIQSEKVNQPEKAEHIDREALLLTAIADIYNTLGDHQQAQKYYNEALSLRLVQLKEFEQAGEVKK
jgi:tetratricopeptide (TPR) repeat protein